MPDPEESDLLNDIQMGELNELGFDPEDPLITNSFGGESLFQGLFNKYMKRDPLLLSSMVGTAGVNPKAFPGAAWLSEKFGTIRNYAIIRIPEVHGHIPMPSMTKLTEAAAKKTDSGELEDVDKMLLSMHDMGFSSPINSGDMPALNPET